MANISGLPTLQRNNSSRNRKDGRKGRTKQTNRQVSLRPTASAGQYYERPGRNPVGNQAEQIATALGNLSPTLGKIGTYMADKKRKEAEQQAQVELQQLSIDDAKGMVDSGEMAEYDNPYFQEAFQRQYGVRLGLHEGQKLATKFNDSYDPRQGGVEDFIAQNMEADIEGIQQNPLVEGGFSDAMEETLVTIRGEATKRTATAYQKDKLDGVYETFDSELSQRLSKAGNKKERKEAIDSAYQAIRSHYPDNKKLLNLSNGDQDSMVMQLAAKYAREGQVDVVEKLLTDDRSGMGSILDKRGKPGADAAKIMSEGISNFEADNRKRTFDDRMEFFYSSEQGNMDEDGLVEWHKENPGALSDAKVQSLIRSNQSAQDSKRAELKEKQDTAGLREVQDQERSNMINSGMEAFLAGQSHNMPNVTITNDQGELEVMTGEEVIEETQAYLENEWVHNQVEGSENPGEDAFNILTEIYSKNPNLKNEQWQRTLENASGALSAAGALDGGSIPPKLKEGFQLYQRLSSRNPGLRDSMISTKDKDVYEAIRIGQEYMGLNFDDSVSTAFKQQVNQDIADNPSIRAQYDEVDAAVAGLDGWLDGWGTVKNDAYVSTELRKIGRHIARSGGPTGLKEATKRFKEEHESINGWVVPTKGKNVPNDFKDIAEEKIQKYVDEHPDEGMSIDDIGIFPVGGSGSAGVWSLVDNSTGSPLIDRVDSQFTLSQLQRESVAARRKLATDALPDGGEKVGELVNELEKKKQKDKIQKGLNLTDEEATSYMDRQGQVDGFLEGAGDLAKGFLTAPNIFDGDNLVNKGYKKLGEGVVTALKEANVTNLPQYSSMSPQEKKKLPDAIKETLDKAVADNPEDNEQVKVKLPSNMNPQVRSGIEKLRDAGITQVDFDQFLQAQKGQQDVELGNGTTGPIETSFAVNPTIREQIRRYLPEE